MDLQEIRQVFNQIPFNQTLGIELISSENENNQTLVHFAMKKELIGNFFHGILHGGVISAVLDAVGGVAVLVAAIQKHTEKNKEELTRILSKTSTVDLHVQFIRPGKGEHFTAKAEVTHSGNKLSFTRMSLYSDSTTLIATASATYLLG